MTREQKAQFLTLGLIVSAVVFFGIGVSTFNPYMVTLGMGSFFMACGMTILGVSGRFL